jgi:Uma2 family endonuclease
VASYDERVKVIAYALAGVPEYAIIDPRTRKLSQYWLDAPGRYADPQIFGEGQTMTFGCLPTLPLAIADLFASAPIRRYK